MTKQNNSKRSRWKLFLLIFNLVIIAIITFFVIDNNRQIDIGFKVPNYNVASEIAELEDTKDFYQKGYDWYKSVENDDGIYLINTTYYSEDILASWQAGGIYKNVPIKPFWQFIVSPSYLDIMGIDVASANIEKAKNGARVFLIPDNYSDDEKDMLERYFREEAENAVSGKAPAARKPEETIETAFYKNPEIIFATYTPNKEYFTFPSQKDVPLTDNAPAILISTTANMIYFESESLLATGINSYIKIKDVDNYLDDGFIQDYGVKFSKISREYKLAELSGYIEKGVNSIFEN